MMWLQNIDNAGSESGAGPVGPGAGRELLWLSIGRLLVVGLGLAALAREVLRKLGL